LEAVFVLLEFSSPSRRIFIGSHSLPPLWFAVSVLQRDGHKDEVCFNRKREERMAKEWANKEQYHPSNGVLEPRVQMPRAKASVRTVPAWGERKAVEALLAGLHLLDR
jgi:hypothetical protein